MLRLDVTILVAPQISPFEFADESINADDMTGVTCMVSKGDFPLQITWTHNSLPIASSDGVAVAKTSKRVSQLTIDSVQAIHAGDYTCTARNKAGEASYTAVLNVNGDSLKLISSCGGVTANIWSKWLYTYFYTCIYKRICHKHTIKITNNII